MGILDSILWLMNRPQQSVFQGADMGRKSFERDRANISPREAAQLNDPANETSLQNIASAIGSGLKSLPAMAIGNLAGWGGLGQDVRGEDLTGGALSGAALDLTADPLAMIPMGQSQKLGTMARTGENMLNLWISGKPSWQFLKDYGLGKALTGLDIAYAPKTAADKLPTVIRGEGNLIPLQQELGKITRDLPPDAYVRGSVVRGPGAQLPADSAFLMADVTQKTPSWVHEFGHWARQNSPDLNELARGFHDYAKTIPDQLAQLPSTYKSLQPWQQAEEQLVRTMNTPEGMKLLQDSILPDVVKQWARGAEAAVPGAALREADPVKFRAMAPQSNISEALSFLGGDIGETYHDLDSRFKNTLAGLIGPKQLQTLWPSAPDKRRPKPAERPDPDYVQGQPAMNWTTQPPDITNWDILKEIASEQWAQRSPSSGYDLRNYNPYADDPLMRFRSGDPWPR